MKKGFTLIELMAVIVIIGLISITTVPLITTRLKDKQKEVDETRNQLIYSAASLYVSDTVSEIGDNSTFCIRINDLVNNGYLDASIGEEVSFNKVVKVDYKDKFKEYDIVDSTNCVATNETYVTVSKLKNKAHSKCNVSTKVDCKNNMLNKVDSFDNPSSNDYQYALSYVYMGVAPSNLVLLGSNCFSIIGITNNNLLKIIYEGPATNGKCNNLAKDNTSTLKKSWFDTESSDGFTTSNIKTLFDNFVNESNLNASTVLGNITFTNIDKQKFEKGSFYIGNYDGMVLQDLLLSEKKLQYTGYVGLINSSDYIMTSMNTNCSLATTSIENYCGDKNFLVSADEAWTLNKTDDNDAVSISNGKIINKNTTASLLLRPVVYLKSNTKLTGNGLSDFPYVVN